MIAVVIGIGLAMLAYVAGTSGDLLDTASIVDALEITQPALYAEQGYATVNVKNNGNTPIDNLYA